MTGRADTLVLTGLQIGDALGNLGRNDEHRKRYGLATSLYHDARGTDDAEFVLLTARGLIDCDGDLSPAAVLRAWQTYILDRGEVFERGGRPLYGAVANLRRDILLPFSGRDNILNNDDGAATHSAPIGIVCAGEPRRAAGWPRSARR